MSRHLSWTFRKRTLGWEDTGWQEVTGKPGMPNGRSRRRLERRTGQVRASKSTELYSQARSLGLIFLRVYWVDICVPHPHAEIREQLAESPPPSWRWNSSLRLRGKYFHLPAISLSLDYLLSVEVRMSGGQKQPVGVVFLFHVGSKDNQAWPQAPLTAEPNHKTQKVVYYTSPNPQMYLFLKPKLKARKGPCCPDCHKFDPWYLHGRRKLTHGSWFLTSTSSMKELCAHTNITSFFLINKLCPGQISRDKPQFGCHISLKIKHC